MSHHDKHTRKKEDPSKSDSSSDELAEQELEPMTMEPKVDESKPQESPKQEPSVSEGDQLNEPTAGPSGLKESRLESADLENKSRELGARPKEKRKRSSKMEDEPTIYENYPRTEDEPTIYENYPRTEDEPTIDENFPQSMVEGESQSSEPGISNYIPSNSDNTESTSPVVCQSSTGVTPPNREEGAVGGAAFGFPEMGLFQPGNVLERLGYQSDSEGPQLRRAAYATDSQHTSLDCSEIQSEMADISPEASAYPKDFPISVHEGQSTSTSDATESQHTSLDCSEIQSEMADISNEASAYPKEFPIFVPDGQSTSTSDTSDNTLTSFGKTTSESMDERLTQSFPEDATRRDSGSGIKSEPSPSKRKREDLRESKKTGKAIDDMLKERVEDNEARKVSSQSCPELRSSSRYRETERSYSVGMKRQESDTSDGTSTSFGKTTSESAETSVYPKEFPISVHEGQSKGTSDTSDGTLASCGKTTSESMDARLTQSLPEDATRRDSGSGIKSEPSPSKRKRDCLRESKETDKAIADVQRQRAEDDEARMVTSQSCPNLQSSSKCHEPGRSYSVGMERNESSEIESLSETETSKLEEGKKSYQKAGQLKFQQATISSGDSFASEEAGSSSSRQQDPSVETKDPFSEKMETSPGKGGESAAENVGSETGETTKVVEQRTEESKRSAKKSKRDPQLSSSPQSDDMKDSPSKAGTSRPKKKAKPDEESKPPVPRILGSSRQGNASTSEDDTILESENED